jgi:hypothetical protein
MEHFCCIVVLSCCSFCVVLSVSSYDPFHVHCTNLGLTKCENICMYVCMYVCIQIPARTATKEGNFKPMKGNKHMLLVLHKATAGAAGSVC